MKIKTLLLLPFLFLYIGCHSQNQVVLGSTPLKIEKKADYSTVQPYYQVDFSAAYCLFEIRVNDVLVFTLNLEGQTSTMVPLNSAILQSGKQQITIKISPLAGQKTLHPSAQFSYNIKVFDAAKNLYFKEQLPGEYAVEKVDPSKKQSFLTHTSSFNAEVPYSITAYQTATDLGSVGGMKEKLQGAYQQLAKLIAKGNLEQIRKLISNRESVVATTMYLSKEESEDRITGMLGNLKSGFKLEPIPENSILKIFGNRKLATLIRPDGNPALLLKNDKANEELGLEFIFYIPEGKTDLEII
ncbi:hypothetical protein DBR11_27385 [Pedobacter sp. HMWF019]|uniref:hypothetical protein n=1 Tax=Pedobacter sp. HMWF019 TaxID=2056856 RepID=UPI000D3B4092|nr:hypothetical protein [Pedobacter sp. HMWF019]PTS92200.1 hypothetical protein DBR11_27385 [Pedobacter sp. HMWF019]